MAFAPIRKPGCSYWPAVAVLGVAGYRASGHAATSSVKAGGSGAVAAADSAAPLAGDAGGARAPPGTLRAWQRIAVRAAPDLRADIEDASATDLYAYAQRLRAQADEGNHEARWMLSRVYDYCAQYAVDPGGYRLDNNVLAGLGLTAAPAMVQARTRRAALWWFRAGRQAGHGLGAVRTSQGGRTRQSGWLRLRCSPRANRCRTAPSTAVTAERVRTSRDPEAFMAIAPAWACAPRVTARSTAWWRASSSVNSHGGLRPANSVYRVGQTVCWSTVFVRTEGSVRRMVRRISGISCMTLRCIAAGRWEDEGMDQAIGWKEERANESPPIPARGQVLVLGGPVRGLLGRRGWPVDDRYL